MAEKASIILAAEDRTRQAFAQVQANLQGLSAGANLLRSSFAGVAGAITAGLAAAQFRDIVSGLDALNDAADATGSTIENLSALEDIAARTGTRFDTVTSTLVRFNQTLNGAEPDSSISRALKAIGLEADDLKKQDPSEALLKTAQALSGYADDGNKARLVQELFGKSIREVAPLLKDLAAQGQLNATVTKAQAEEAEKFNKQLAALEKNAADAGRSLASSLLPVLNQIFDRAKGISAGGGFFASIGKEVRANLLTEELNTAVRELELVQKRIDFGEKGLERRSGALRVYIADVQRQLLTATDAIKGFANAANPVAPRGRPANEGGGRIIEQSVGNIPGSNRPRTKSPKPDVPFVGPDEFEPLRAAIRRLEQTDTAKVAALRAELEQLLSIGGATPAPKVAEAIRQVSDALEQADPVGPGLPASLKAAFDAIDQTDTRKAAALTEQLQQLLSIQGSNAGTEVAEAIANIRREIDALDPKKLRLAELLGATDSALLEKTRADMQLLADALLQEEINAEKYAEAVNKRLGNELPKNLERTKGLSEELGLTFSSAFEDALVKGEDLSNLLKGLEQDITRILVRRFVTQPLADSLGNFISGILPGLGSASTGSSPTGGTGLVIKSAKGNAFDNAPGLSAYSGSVVNRPTLFPFARGAGVMGEAGPEAILPLTRVAGELGVRAIASGQPTGAITFAPVFETHIDARTDAQQVVRLVAESNAQSERRVFEQLKSLGVLQ